MPMEFGGCPVARPSPAWCLSVPKDVIPMDFVLLRPGCSLVFVTLKLFEGIRRRLVSPSPSGLAPGKSILPTLDVARAGLQATSPRRSGRYGVYFRSKFNLFVPEFKVAVSWLVSGDLYC